eukprot:5236221-Pyramimonas_sp.AAC.1
MAQKSGLDATQGQVASEVAMSRNSMLTYNGHAPTQAMLGFPVPLASRPRDRRALRGCRGA